MSGAPSNSGTLRFSFNGDTPEYFRIFYVNLFLTIATFGIYSAWAKVRSRRFFYGHLYLGGRNLDFDARPLSILTARVIVLLVVATLLFSENLLALVWEGIGAMTLLLFFLLPFALVRGRAFNARHTLWRSVRFRYVKNYRPSYWLYVIYYLFAWIALTAAASRRELDEANEFLWYTIVVAITYWILLFPFYYYYRHKILVNQFCFGSLGMSYHAKVRSYYKLMVASLLWVIPTLVLYASAWALTFLIFDPSRITSLYAAQIFVFGAGFLGLCMIGVLRSKILPLFYSSIKLSDGSTLSCSIKPRTYLFKYFVLNLFVIIMSLGILLPWARVRSWRYVTESLTLNLSPETAAVLASEEDNLGPLGEEFSDIQDFDLDFGFI